MSGSHFQASNFAVGVWRIFLERLLKEPGFESFFRSSTLYKNGFGHVLVCGIEQFKTAISPDSGFGSSKIPSKSCA